MSTHTTDPVRLTIEDPVAAAAISRIRWRVAKSGPWLEENTFAPPPASIVIERPALTDILIEVTWHAGACDLREPLLPAPARSRGDRPPRGPARRARPRRGGATAAGACTMLYVLPGTQSGVASRD
jgi:hypothetical protein